MYNVLYEFGSSSLGLLVVFLGGVVAMQRPYFGLGMGSFDIVSLDLQM